MGFSALNLHPLIEKAILHQGYETPTPIQSQAIPTILEGKDVSASAATGSGKTAAFVLPALHFLQNSPPNGKCKVLILTPTRELALQIADAVKTYGKFVRFKMASLVGGMSYHHQIRDLSRGADLIIATPGRLLDHHKSKRLNLSSVSMLILDEADRMVDMGFIDDVRAIEELTPKNRQTLLFSATLDKRIDHITKNMLKEPAHINLSKKLIASDHIDQSAYKVKNHSEKFKLLKELISEKKIYKGIIFSATKMYSDRLAVDLSDAGFESEALHGDLKQRERNRVLKRFRDGEIQFLVATDVASRGIHVDDLTHVFNYDIPKSPEDYVHRIGRTGRAGQTGTAITFITSNEFFLLKRIEKYIGKSIFVHVTQGSDSPRKEKEAFKKDKGKDKKRFRKSFNSETFEAKRSRKSFKDRDNFKDKDRFKDKDKFKDKDRFKDKKKPFHAKEKFKEKSADGQHKKYGKPNPTNPNGKPKKKFFDSKKKKPFSSHRKRED